MQKMRILPRKGSAVGASAASACVGATQTRKISVTLGQIGGNTTYVVPTSRGSTIHICRSDLMRVECVEKFSVKSLGNRHQVAGIT